MSKEVERRGCAVTHERFDQYEKKVDEHDALLKGNENGKRGYNVRISILEDNMSLIKWLGGALFLTTLSTFAGIIVILLRLPK